MSRKLLVLSSLIIAMGAVTFDVSEAEAGRCCRNRGRRCCNVGWGGCGYQGGCGMACNIGCNRGCGVQVAYNNCAPVQPCSFQGGCPVGGRLIANPDGSAAPPAPPAPAAAPQPTVEPLAPPPPQ